MFALINEFEESTILLHFKSILKVFIDKYGCKFFTTNDLSKHKGNLKKYIVNTYKELPLFIITFYGIGSFCDIIDEINSLNIKLVILSDDIHHSIRLASNRIPVFNKCYKSFNTYGYQINKWNIPKLNNNYFFPHSANWILDFNENPINKILVSGSINLIYPDREFVVKLKNKNIDILKLDLKNNIWGENFYKHLNKYLCCFVDTPRDYILAKVFEICGSGSLLLCMNNQLLDIFEKLGFIDNQNYISCTRENILEKISFILHPENRQKIDEIRKNGLELIRNKHNVEYRAQTLFNILVDNFKVKEEKNDKLGIKYNLAF
jgi:hypothetical protein